MKVWSDPILTIGCAGRVCSPVRWATIGFRAIDWRRRHDATG
ncbi:hypothetical protein C7S15_4522 [Burkholderia cepacia]|nr:hypothetical protein [Burkholderia cepacia]